MANTFELITSSTVGAGGASDITFSTIAGTYTDLCVKLSARLTAAAFTQSLTVQFNGSTSGYSSRNLRGSGSAASSVSDVYGTDEIYVGEIPAASATASTFGNMDLYIPNYAGSNNKSLSVDIVTEDNQTLAWAYLSAGLWSNSAAITSIKLIPNAGNFAQYSTAYLYGVKNA